MKNKSRRNNLELKQINNPNFFEIVKWEPNPYYNKQNEYTKVGEYYKPQNSFGNIHESCFINKEMCYTLAYVERGVVRYVGNRPFDNLKNTTEFKDFLYLIRLGVKWSQSNLK